jgi:hypothetical protein
MKFIERLMPNSQTLSADDEFKKFVNVVILIYRQMIKYVKLSHAVTYLKAFMPKLLLYNNWGLLNKENLIYFI